MAIGIRDLKNSLSKQLAAVRRGQTITVTNHGRPIARIVPVGASPYECLVAEGRITRATGAPRPIPAPVVDGATISDLLAAWAAEGVTTCDIGASTG